MQDDDRGDLPAGWFPVALIPLCVLFWVLCHGYRGLFHDARLYTLQALSRIDPASLSQDVFLRFGSQDRFTMFSPLYEAGIRLLGAEWAASLLTVASQGALFLGAWLLARAVFTPRLALFGLAALIAIPGDYGTGRIFACVEPFLTPRMGAEALVLGCLAAALRGRSRTALMLMVLAFLLHPLMAAAGAGALFFLYVLIPRPRIGAAILGAGMLLVGALFVAALHAAPGASTASAWAAFDPAWLHMVRERSPYLFLSSWIIDDWSRLAVTLATLIMGAVNLQSEQARRLCQAAALTTVGGLLLCLIACDGLHVVWTTQLQPWRWQWLGVAVAALTLPAVLRTCAAAEAGTRAAALLLVAAWIFGAVSFALWAALAAVAALARAPRLEARESRWILFGAVCLLAIALTWRVAGNLEFTSAHYMESYVPSWQRRATSFAEDGSVPLAVLALAWWLAQIPGGRTGLISLGLIASAICAALLPQAWEQWTKREFAPARVAEFAPWRKHIPAGAQVFWPDMPLGAWLLLDRPSYLSPMQGAGVVFSRSTAFELQRRALSLQSVLAPQAFLSWSSGSPNLSLSVSQLESACRLAVFDYLVTRTELGFPPVAELTAAGAASTASTRRVASPLRLYRCSAGGDSQARAVAAAT